MSNTYLRPGIMYPVIAAAARVHGQAVLEENRVGVAVKQKGVGSGIAAGAAAAQAIAIGERYVMIVKGVVQVPNTGIDTLEKGDQVFIDDTTMALGATGDVLFGQVRNVAGDDGTPTGFVRIDLDVKPIA